MARCCDPPIEEVAFGQHKWGRALERRPRGDRHSSHQAGRSGNGTDVLAPRSSDPPRMHANGPPDHKERDLLMAKENPTDGGRTVALTIPSKDREFLRRVFTMALDGIRDELDNYPDDLREPTHLHREEGIYERLLSGLAGESIVPDHYMRQMLRDLTEMNDRENEYARVVAEHEALLSLRKRLGEGKRR